MRKRPPPSRLHPPCTSRGTGSGNARFAVYRTYFQAQSTDSNPDDVQQVTAAIKPQTGRPDLDPELIDFLGEILMLHLRDQFYTELALWGFDSSPVR